MTDNPSIDVGAGLPQVEYPDFRSLEDHLTCAEVLEVFPWDGGGGHASKAGVLLAGGLLAIAKLQIDPTTIQQGKNERAGFVVAKATGCGDLIAATVLRPVRHPDLAATAAAVQVAWPAAKLVPPDLAVFSAEDVERAAMFDWLITQSDRNNNNYMGIPRHDGTMKLVFYDQGNAFGPPYSPSTNSDFLNRKVGEPVSDVTRRRLERLDEARPELESLLTHEQVTRLFDRRDQLAAAPTFQPG